ncbi:membrane associated rhomboid family serine protease [Dysgonomonadaceae bacterium PH5-43]|nr:membrane associated rhomboid family serine protease [Dysgonomonadaceae bacterium PH5-43]
MTDNNSFINSIPPVTKNILIINLIVFAACNLLKAVPLSLILAIKPIGLGFSAYQLITYMFTHVDFGHFFFNMFAVFMFGRIIESYWGTKRYIIYYLVTGIGAGLIQLLVCFLTGSFAYTIGASGAVFGLLLAFGMLFPNAPIYIMFIPIPIKAKYMVIGYGILELLFGISDRAGDNVAHFAHLGGMLFGILLIFYWKKKGANNGNGFYY